MPAISVVISNVLDIRKKEKKELLLHSMLHRYTSLHHHHAATCQGDVSKLMVIKIGDVVSVFSHCSNIVVIRMDFFVQILGKRTQARFPWLMKRATFYAMGHRQ